MGKSLTLKGAGAPAPSLEMHIYDKSELIALSRPADGKLICVLDKPFVKEAVFICHTDSLLSIVERLASQESNIEQLKEESCLLIKQLHGILSEHKLAF